MEAVCIELRHNVEEEGIRIVVQSFVVEEQLCKQTQVLRIVFVFTAVDLEEGDGVLAVYFVPRRMEEVAFLHVSLKTRDTFHVFETEVADIDTRYLREFDRVGGKVPRLDAVFTCKENINQSISFFFPNRFTVKSVKS